jgi:hypothetical protein
MIPARLLVSADNILLSKTFFTAESAEVRKGLLVAAPAAQ